MMRSELDNKVVTANIGNARRLADRYGPLLQADPLVAAQLGKLAGLLAVLEQQMARLGLPELCTECAREPRGGCCFAGMAAEADSALLTANLLLGGRVAVRTGDPNLGESDCCFLGPAGCTLRLKPLFCLSYNCPKIIEGSSDRGLAALDTLSAQVLREQLVLEDRIRHLTH